MEIVLGRVLVELVNEVIGPLIKELGFYLERALRGLPAQITHLFIFRDYEREDWIEAGFLVLSLVFIVLIIKVYNRDK